MDNTLPQTVGIDISKAVLDVYAHPAGSERQFANTIKGHSELIDWLAQWQIDRIAYEATGAYHRLLEQALADRNCPPLCFRDLGRQRAMVLRIMWNGRAPVCRRAVSTTVRTSASPFAAHMAR